MEETHPYFVEFNANPWNKSIPDCGIRSVALATGMPYVDVCRKLGFSFKKGHGLIRDSGIFLEHIKEAFDDRFDVVVDFSETLPPNAVPDFGYDTAALFDDEDDISNETSLVEWMELNRGEGKFLVGLHNPNGGTGGHLVFADTDAMKFYDTWDCSDWKVDAWMRLR